MLEKDKKRLQEVEMKVAQITDKNQEKQAMANRWDNWVLGSILLVYLFLGISSALLNKWNTLMFTVSLMIWVGIVWMSQRQINFLNYMLNQQYDLSQLERDTVLDLVKSKKGKK